MIPLNTFIILNMFAKQRISKVLDKIYFFIRLIVRWEYEIKEIKIYEFPTLFITTGRTG